MKTQALTFRDLLDGSRGGAYVEKVFSGFSKERKKLFKRWYRQTGEFDTTGVYPSQGLLRTPYDFLDVMGTSIMPEDQLWETLKMRRYMLEIFNHPDRLEALSKVQKQSFKPPQKVSNHIMEDSFSRGLALSVRDLGAQVVGTDGSRVGRRALLQSGPFLKLGKQARIPFSSGAMPDVFGAPAALATVAMTHALANVPRNGVFSQLKRQVDLIEAVFAWMESEEMLNERADRRALLSLWKKNVVGVVEPELNEGMKRAKALFKAGVRSFRVYSPEPGKDAELLVQRLRKTWGGEVEIFVGQVASVSQGVRLQEAGADGLHVGIGGGGRCITAVRSGSVVDWPNLLWQMRGEVTVPVIVEGGASDHIGVTLLLGASGIGVSRIAGGGTIESPGGLLFWVNRKGQWFKPYGGEASARTKYLDNKMLAVGLPAFVEGETTMALKSYVPYAKPTVAENMYFLVEDLVLSLVFRGATTIADLQAIDPSPLRRVTEHGVQQQGTH